MPTGCRRTDFDQLVTGQRDISMIELNVDTKPTYEAMKRGGWPEPNSEVMVPHKALNVEVEHPIQRKGGDEQRKGTQQPG